MNTSSKLLVLLNSLEPIEMKELALWLNSPLFNRSSKTIDLFVFLRKKVWKKEISFPLYKAIKATKLLSSESTSKNVSPKDKQALWKIAGQLTQQIEEYLKWKKFKDQKIYGNWLLMNTYLEKQLYDQNKILLNKTRKLHEQSSFRDIAHCKDEFTLSEMEFFMEIILKNRKAGTSMIRTMDSLRIASFAHLLRYYCILTNFKNLVSLESESSFKKVLLMHLEDNEVLNDFTVNLYYRLLLMLESGKNEDYFTFKETLFSSLTSFDKNELRQLFAFMSNFCLRKANEGDTTLGKELFEIYEQGLKMGCWTAGIYFSQHQFIRILEVSLHQKKLDWAKQFIETYKDSLDPNLAKNTMLYSKSTLAFHEKNFDLSQEYLSKITKLEDFYSKLEAKVLLVKIYYENDLSFETFEGHPIHSELEALKVNTLKGSGKKIAAIARPKFSNFSVILKKVLSLRRLKFNGKLSRSKINALTVALENLKPVTSRTWLKEKLEEL